MHRKIIGCLLVIPLFLTACGQRVDADPDTVNIMCYSDQAQIFSRLRLTAFCYDNSIEEPHYITEKDYDGMGEFRDALYKNIMTQSQDIDIFFISNMDKNARKIIEDHYYVDLAQDEVLAQRFDDMYPEIREWSSWGDEVFGYPYDFFPYMTMMVDEAQTARTGYGREDFQTVDDLLSFCGVWRDQYSTPPVEGFTLIDWYYYNYILQRYDHATGEMNLDTPEF